MFRIFIVITFLVALTSTSKATDTTEISYQYTTLDIGADFSSNSGQYGHFNDIAKQPSLAPYIYYSWKKGAQLSLTASRIVNGDSTYSNGSNEVDLMAGWNFYLFKEKLAIMPSFTHFVYAPNMSPERTYYKNQALLNITGTFKWFTPMVSGYYLMGITNDYFLSLYPACSFVWDNFKNEAVSICFNPALGFNFGNQSYYRKWAIKFYDYIEPLKQRWGNLTVGELLARRRINLAPELKKRLQKLNPNKRLSDFLEPETTFNLSSIDLSIPIILYYNNFTYMLSVNISEPFNVPQYLNLKTTVYASVGIIYTFSFD